MLRLLREHRTHFIATFAFCWVVLVATEPGIPIVWDEGEYLVRAHQITEWFRYLPGAFSREGMQRHWLFINYSEGHPAGFAIPIALSQWLASPFIDPLTAARLGPITLFSIACAVVAVRLRESHGRAAAIATPVALLTFPRMFSEAHFATQDAQLTASWLVLWAVQSTADTSRRSTIALGVVLGLTTATKFTGWLAWSPTALSQLAQRNRAAVRQFLIVAPLALLTFYALNPPLWFAPISGMGEHFHRSLDRANTLNISTQFLGRLYNVTNPLPWYNTIVWLVFVTPLTTFILGIVGLSQCLLTRNLFSVTLTLHWITLMVVRALPGAPPHDGIRLFLPAFGFWCVFAAIGTQITFNAIAGVDAPRWRSALRAALLMTIVAPAVTIARYYPQTLSHYSVLAGGLRGAADKGMEPAYWWDGLDNDVLRWLNQRTDPHEGVAFSTISNMGQLHAWGRLRPRDVNPETDPFKWYVLQNRPGLFSRTDRMLMRREQPVFTKYAGRRGEGMTVPSDLDVPLIAIFSFDQYQRARR
jgi:hypothetical protein